MNMVTLKNGTEVAEPLIIAAMLSLQTLMQKNPVAFYELVQLCKDRNHRLFGNTGAILKDLALVENGTIHDALRNIILSAVEGEGLDMRLVNPTQ